MPTRNKTQLLKTLLLTSFLCLYMLTPGCCASGGWQAAVAADMPRLGHRNWIAIVDSAYPLQSRNGIQTIVANASQTTVLKAILADINASRHVRPIIYTDSELQYVDDKDAPGVTAYRTSLARILGKQPVSSLLHEQIIHKLDQEGQTFNVLIIKTNMTIPYTSVFLQLNCKYWSAAEESRLRTRMQRTSSRPSPS